MYFGYGIYRSALSEAGISFARESIQSEATGLQIGIKETWTVTGMLQAPLGPLQLATMMAALELACAANFQNVFLLANNGITVLRSMLGVTPLGGTRVVSAPSYLEDGRSNAEGSTFRTYRVVIEGKYIAPGFGTAAALTLAWHESISQRGTGGPRFVMRQGQRGPQKQIVALTTPVHVVQRGHAVGLNDYPPAPEPIWPEAEHEDQREIELSTPQRSGSVFLEYPLSWTFVYEDMPQSDLLRPNQFRGV